MVFNSDMELGLEGYWRAAGSGHIANNIPGFGSVGVSMRSWSRERVWDGPEYVVQRNTFDGCVPPLSVWKLKARLMLVDPITNKGKLCITDPGYNTPLDYANGDDFCPKISIYLRDNRGTLQTFRVGGYPEVWDPENYNDFETTFTFPEPSGGWTSSIRYFKITINQMNPGADLLVDDVYFTRIS